MLYTSHLDANGYLYCARIDDVAHGSTLECAQCPYFAGSMQGMGRECEVGEDDKVIDIPDGYAYMNSKKILSEGGA